MEASQENLNLTIEQLLEVMRMMLSPDNSKLEQATVILK